MAFCSHDLSSAPSFKFSSLAQEFVPGQLWLASSQQEASSVAYDSGQLEATLHPHPVALRSKGSIWVCNHCCKSFRKSPRDGRAPICYRCTEGCNFYICGDCHAIIYNDLVLAASSEDDGERPGLAVCTALSLSVRIGLGENSRLLPGADRSWTGADAKAAIEAIAGIPPHEQRLLLQTGEAATAESTPLEDDDVLGKVLPVGSTVAELRVVRLDPAWAEAMLQVKKNGQNLATLEEKFRWDRQLVLAAVLSDAKAMKFALDFRSDRDFALAAIRKDPSAVKYVAEVLKHDRTFAFAALQIHGAALKYLGQELREDIGFLLQAVHANPRVLKYASEALRSSHDFVLRAAEMTSPQPVAAEEVARLRLSSAGAAPAPPCAGAQTSGPRVLKYAAESLRYDREFLLHLVHRWGQTLKYAPDTFRSDPAFVLEAVEANWTALKYADGVLWQHTDIVHAVVRQQGSWLKHAGETLQRSSELVLAALRSDASAWKYASGDLRRQPAFIAAALTANPSVHKYMCVDELSLAQRGTTGRPPDARIRYILYT